MRSTSIGLAPIVFTLALASALVCFYWPFLTGRCDFYIFDLFAQWHQLLTYVGDRLRHGELPLWNPYVLTGIPQMFYPNILYPLNWLFAGFDFSCGLAIILTVQQLACGLGMYLLVASLDFGTGAAAFAGGALGLCGLMFTLQHAYMVQGPIAWFPLSLWSLRQINSQSAHSKLTFTALCAVFTGLMVGVGQPDMYLPGLMLMGLYVAISFIRHVKSARLSRRVLALRLLALVLGVMSAAPLLLSMAEWAGVSPRAAGLPISEVLRWSSSWYDLLCVVLSQPLGDFFAHNRFIVFVAPWYDYKPGTFTPTFSSAYLGSVVCTLAIWGSFDRTWSGKWFVLALLLVATILTLGSHTPVAAFLVNASHITFFRFPFKLLFWIVVPLILLSARGYLMVIRGNGTRALAATSAVWGSLLVLAAAVIFIKDVGQLTAVAGLLGLAKDDALAVPALKLFAHATILSATLALVACALFYLRIRQVVSAFVAGGLLTALALLSLLSHAWEFEFHPAPANFYRTPVYLVDQIKKFAESAGHKGLIRVAALMEGKPVPERLASRPLSENYAYDRQILNMQLSETGSGIALMNDAVGQTGDIRKLWDSGKERFKAGFDRSLSTLCQMTSVQYVATLNNVLNHGFTYRAAPLNPRYFKLLLQDAFMNVSVSEVIGHLPRAYMAPMIKWGSPHPRVLEFLQNPERSGFDPGRLTILEHVDGQTVVPTIAVTDEQWKRSTADIVVDQPEHLTVNAATPKDNFLVVTDQFYPGWQAYVDGRRANIYPANAISRAVFIPSGRHRVDFVYHPLGFWTGVAIACADALLLSLLLCLALCMFTDHATIIKE